MVGVWPVGFNYNRYGSSRDIRVFVLGENMENMNVND